MHRLVAAALVLVFALVVTIPGLPSPASATTYTMFEGGVAPAGCCRSGDTVNMIMSQASKWVFNPVTGQYELHNWYRRCYDYGGMPWLVTTLPFHGVPGKSTAWCLGVDF